MSQTGLYTEHELPDRVRECFDLKLDKEAFIKPSREIVVEIYTRFLDRTVSIWRKPRNPNQPDPPLIAQMICWLRYIFSRYDIAYEFGSTDLTNPNRKRTTTFLNVILLFWADFHECLVRYQECQDKLEHEKEKAQMLNREISDRRVLLEELALKKGGLADKNQLEEEIQAMRRAFEIKQNGCSKLTEEPARIKESISRLLQEEQIKLVARQEIAQRIERESQRKKLKLKEADLREKLSDLNRNLGELKIRNSLRLKEEQTIEQRIEEEKTQVIQKIKDRQSISKAKIEALKKEYADLDDHLRNYSEEVQEYINRANSEVKALKRRYENSRGLIGKSKTRTTNYRVKLNELTGIERTVLPVENSKDRTFIKSSQDQQRN